MRHPTIDSILAHKLIAIARRVPPDALLPLAEALYAGGVRLLELTFDPSDPGSWPDTCRGIAALSAAFAGRILPGAGTVLALDQLRMARDAGARYIVSPDMNPELIHETVGAGLVSLPGCLTPTEIAAALRAGADFVKLFPAGDLGTGYVRSVLAPLSHANVLAVGGIDPQNAADFLKAGCVGVGIGGSLVNKARIAAGAYDEIAATARACVRSLA